MPADGDGQKTKKKRAVGATTNATAGMLLHQGADEAGPSLPPASETRMSTISAAAQGDAAAAVGSSGIFAPAAAPQQAAVELQAPIALPHAGPSSDKTSAPRRRRGLTAAAATAMDDALEL